MVAGRGGCPGKIEKRAHDANGLAQLAEAGFYKAVPVRVCRSADIPTPVGMPIAQEFANTTGLPTKGFRGAVAARKEKEAPDI